jgi:hypothetical protein
MIVRRLLGLEPVISLGICGPEHDWRSWKFDLDPGEVDPVLGIHELREAFEKAEPGYDRGVTVPAIVDVRSGEVVTADFRHITFDMESAWADFHRQGAPDLYPDKLRDEIEEVSSLVYEDLNNGVYRCGFATTRSPRLISGCGRRLPGSTPFTTTTSSATGTSWPRCRCCGRTRATCFRRPGSATRSTSSRPSSTTTGSTPA